MVHLLPNFKLCPQIKKKLCYKSQEVLWIFKKNSSSQNYPYSLPFFQIYYYHLIYSLYFHHLLKLITLLFPRKDVKTNFQRFKLKVISKKITQIIQIRAFKKKEKEGGEGRSQLCCQWKVPSLVSFGRTRKNIIFTCFHFPPNKF
jgi:hypothetical protein